MESVCCICKSQLDAESAAILTLSGYGTPRYICDGCDADISLSTSARDLSEIGAAMDRISKKMTKHNPEDPLVLKSVEEIMASANERAEKIKAGDYDFSAEDALSEEADEQIPEELLESEEDRELDRIEAEKNKKLDKITNIICLAIIAAAIGFLAYRIITRLI